MFIIYPSNIFRDTRIFENWIFHSLSWGILSAVTFLDEGNYLMDYKGS